MGSDLTEMQKLLRYYTACTLLVRYEHKGEPLPDEIWAKLYELVLKFQSNKR